MSATVDTYQAYYYGQDEAYSGVRYGDVVYVRRITQENGRSYVSVAALDDRGPDYAGPWLAVHDPEQTLGSPLPARMTVNMGLRTNVGTLDVDSLLAAVEAGDVNELVRLRNEIEAEVARLNTRLRLVEWALNAARENTVAAA